MVDEVFGHVYVLQRHDWQVRIRQSFRNIDDTRPEEEKRI